MRGTRLRSYSILSLNLLTFIMVGFTDNIHSSIYSFIHSLSVCVRMFSRRMIKCLKIEDYGWLWLVLCKRNRFVLIEYISAYSIVFPPSVGMLPSRKNLTHFDLYLSFIFHSPFISLPLSANVCTHIESEDADQK